MEWLVVFLACSLSLALVLLHKCYQQTNEDRFDSNKPQSTATLMLGVLAAPVTLIVFAVMLYEGWFYGESNSAKEFRGILKRWKFLYLSGDSDSLTSDYERRQANRSFWCKIGIHDWYSRPGFYTSDQNGTPFASSRMCCGRENCMASKRGESKWLRDDEGMESLLLVTALKAQKMPTIRWPFCEGDHERTVATIKREVY